MIPFAAWLIFLGLQADAQRFESPPTSAEPARAADWRDPLWTLDDAFSAGFASGMRGPRAPQEEELLARGQKYLDKIAKTWSADLPVKRLVGIYIGRKWMGYMRLTIKAAPKGTGAAFEIDMVGEVKIEDKVFSGRGRTLLAKDLSPVSVEFFNNEPEVREGKELSVEGGHWKLRCAVNGKIAETEGELKTATTWGAEILPLFAIPEDDVIRVVSLDSEKGPYRFAKLPRKRPHRVGAKTGEFRVLELNKGEDKPDLCYYGEEGGVIEIVPQGGPARLVPIDESEMGKNLDEPLALKPPERAVIDLFLSIKRNDRKAVLACFDIERLTAEMVPAFADMPPQQQSEAVAAMPARLADYLLSERMRSSLPEKDVLEEGIASGMKTTVDDDGVAKVELFGQQTWRLAQATEGDRKGKWLIIGVGPKDK